MSEKYGDGKPFSAARRRFVVVSAAGALLAACGGSDEPVDTAARRAVDAGLVGAAFGFVDGTHRSTAVAGRRQIDRDARIASDDRLVIGSNTKAMTATVAAACVQQGSIGWTTPIATALPGIAARMLPVYDRPRLRDPVRARDRARPRRAGRVAFGDTAAVVASDPEQQALKPWLEVLSPAGAWSCTPASYAAWLARHVDALARRPSRLPADYVDRLRTVAPGTYALGWLKQAIPANPAGVLVHTGQYGGFMTEAVVDLRGARAAFGMTNTSYMADDGTSWVLAILDHALADLWSLPAARH